MRGSCVPILALTLIANPGAARTWDIRVDGSGDAPTIQAGIDSAASGDSVVVAAGVYDENLDMQGKPLVLRSTSGPDVTVVDGGQRNRVLAMTGGVVDGFTLQNGACDNCGGGGVLVVRPGPATIRNCIIQNNVAGYFPETGGGGGIYIDLISGVLVENCIVRNNHGGEAGGGLFDWGNGNIVRGCMFIGNSTAHGGGGMFVGDTQVIDNLVLDNESSTSGGGIHADGPAILRNNTVVRNRVGYGSAAGIWGIYGPVISHNIVALNGPGAGIFWQGSEYPDCNDIWGNETDVIGWPGTGNGNFSSDPVFCDAAKGEYHLADFSPCLPANNSCAALIGALGAGCTVSDAVEAERSVTALSISPNPPRSRATIKYSFAPATQNAQLTVYDLRGRVVARLANAEPMRSHGSVVWDGRDAAGVPVGSGLYIVRLETEAGSVSRKIAWIR